MKTLPNTTPIDQDRETLTFKALHYLNVAVQVQVCRLFLRGVYPIVQLGYPAITNNFVGNQIIRFIIQQIVTLSKYGPMMLSKSVIRR